MNTERLLYTALGTGAIGAALVFALDSGSSVGSFNAQPLGGVILGLALALLIGATISLVKPTGTDADATRTGADTIGTAPGSTGAKTSNGELVNEEALRAITGLVAVVAGIVAVGALTIVAIKLVGVGEEGNTEATVAVTTSAFGIVSTVITAYLGIKATANAGKESRVEKNPPKETKVERGGE